MTTLTNKILIASITDDRLVELARIVAKDIEQDQPIAALVVEQLVLRFQQQDFRQLTGGGSRP